MTLYIVISNDKIHFVYLLGNTLSGGGGYCVILDDVRRVS